MDSISRIAPPSPPYAQHVAIDPHTGVESYHVFSFAIELAERTYDERNDT